MRGLGVWRYRSFASSWWFFLPGVYPASFQEFTLGSTLSTSSLYSSYWNPAIFFLTDDVCAENVKRVVDVNGSDI
jgi:hypothetical protein